MSARRNFLKQISLWGLAMPWLPGEIWKGAHISPQKNIEMDIARNVMIPMRDGVPLACDIYRPIREGEVVQVPLPVILERTPYGKHLPSRTELHPDDLQKPKSRTEVAEFFVRNGYVVIYQDCRGRYQSEGQFVKYLNEAPDGYDTCAWIVEQAWCNGKIGSKGFSYAAHTQTAMASLGAPGLSAMFVDSGGFANAYQGGIRQGGAFELKQATWAFRNAQRSPEVQNDPAKKKAFAAIDLKAWFRKMPWQKGNSPLSLAPAYEDYLFEQWTHGNFDDYWQQAGIYAQGFYENFPDIPQLYMSAWYDPYPRTAVENYLGLVDQLSAPVYLVLGPWLHGSRSFSEAGDVDFGAEARLEEGIFENYFEYRLRFFNHYLKDQGSFEQIHPPVKVFVMGGGSGRKNAQGKLEHGGSWLQASKFPPPITEFLPYYLHQDGSLNSQAPTAKEAFLEYTYDPRDPVPTIGGAITSGQPLMEGGAYNQVEAEVFFGSELPYRPLSERPDVLVFQTEPLPRTFELIGSVEARLWVASDALDTDFTIKLIDVYPPNEDYPEGYALNLCDGILRMRYRDSWEKPEMMEPANIYEIKIETFPMANLFQVGHRIRVDISSSNFPRFDLNFNTGEPEGRATRVRVARNRIYTGQLYPSRVILPFFTPA